MIRPFYQERLKNSKTMLLKLFKHIVMCVSKVLQKYAILEDTTRVQQHIWWVTPSRRSTRTENEVWKVRINKKVTLYTMLTVCLGSTKSSTFWRIQHMRCSNIRKSQSNIDCVYNVTFRPSSFTITIYS